MVDKNIYYLLTEPSAWGDFQMDAVLLEQLWEQSRGETMYQSGEDYWKKRAAFMEGSF